ncbi:type II secretion system protein [Geminisphaera colitermitum]|uniref:type II secretion system protein n=1 Tax=Geminisphaera colitermitum TaxID=1148786 RepID=UPI000158D273|nr:DUF1559 domain-containing protein [Geminisphaera colitermitum]
MHSPTSNFRPALVVHVSSAAFTLIELLTVIAIIGILAAIIIPTAGRVRESARDAQCKSNLRQIGVAVTLYVNDNRVWPYGNSPTLVQELAPYLNPNATTPWSGTKIDECPSRKIIVNDGTINRSYGANPFVFVDGGTATPKKTRTPPGKVTRHSETILCMDACQRDTGSAHSRMANLEPSSVVSQNPSDADNLVPPVSGEDVDGTSIAIYRFRHSGQKTNAVRADASIATYAKGTLKNRHFAIEY